MKNLKKVLALVLVVAMMASFAVGASAAFTDEDDISADYSVAVDVLTGMKVINGYADGSFRPDGNVTRGAFAKMVAYVMTSGKNAPSSYATSAALAFSDVEATATLAPSIGYAVAKGYVSGYSDGTFRSGNSVSGLAAAKILLGALGFEGQYTGAGWDINVLSDGEEAGLFEGMDSVDLAKALSREEAAQMIWNALNYSKQGATAQYVVKNGSNVVLYQGTDALTAMAMSSVSGNVLSVETSTTDSLGYTKFGLKKTSIPDDFGREPVTYTNGKTGTDQVVYASFAATPVLTYTTGTTQGKIATALGAGANAGTGVKLNINTNGAGFAEVSGLSEVLRTSTTPIGGQGTLVEVYKTATKDVYNVVVVNTYAKKLVARTDITPAKAATATADAIEASITINGLTYKTDAFKDGDVVLYTATASKIVNVVKADYINGKVSATASNYFRVDGEQKYLSATNSSVTIGTTAGYKYETPAVEYTYYLDFYGNVILAEQGAVAPVAKNYTYVIATAAKAAVAGEGADLFTPSAGSAAVAQAKVIDLETGAIKVVNLGVVQDASGAYVYANNKGAATTDTVTGDAPRATAGIYEYVVLSDGSYVLGAAPETGVNVSIAKNSAAVTGVTGAYANAATTVTVVEYTTNAQNAIVSAAVTTMTGIANFPQTASYTGAIVDVNTTAKTINSILVVAPKAAATATVDFAVYVGAGEFGTDGQAYTFYQDGKAVDYYLVDGTSIPAELAADDVAALTLEDGKIKTITEATAAKQNKTVDVLDDTYAVIDGIVYYFAENYTVVDKNAGYAASALTVGASVDVYTVTVGGNTLAAFFVVVG